MAALLMNLAASLVHLVLLYSVCGLSQPAVTQQCSSSVVTFQRLDNESLADGINFTIIQTTSSTACLLRGRHFNSTVVGFQRDTSNCYLNGALAQTENTQKAPADGMEFWFSTDEVLQSHEPIPIVGSSESSVETPGSKAANLYDGLTAGSNFLDTKNEFEPWARLYFTSPAIVTDLVVYNRNDTGALSYDFIRQRSASLEFRVARTVETLPDEKSFCYHFPLVIDVVQPIICERPLMGIILQIKIPNRTGLLNLHEVTVFGTVL